MATQKAKRIDINEIEQPAVAEIAECRRDLAVLRRLSMQLDTRRSVQSIVEGLPDPFRAGAPQAIPELHAYIDNCLRMCMEKLRGIAADPQNNAPTAKKRITIIRRKLRIPAAQEVPPLILGIHGSETLNRAGLQLVSILLTQPENESITLRGLRMKTGCSATDCEEALGKIAKLLSVETQPYILFAEKGDEPAYRLQKRRGTEENGWR